MLLSLLLALGGVPPAGAAAPAEIAGFTITPPLIEAAVEPGQSFTKVMTVYNESDKPQVAGTEVQNFLPGGPNGDRADFTTEATPFPLAEWVTLEPVRQVIPPQASADFTLHIKVPQNAAPGGHFGSVSFTPVVPAVPGTVRVEQSVTTLVLLRVAGGIVEQLRLESFNSRPAAAGEEVAEPRSLYADTPVHFTARLRNEGNVHVKPTVEVAVRGLFGGGTIATNTTTPGATVGYVLPGSSRTYAVPVSASLLPGRYRADLTVTYGEGRTLTSSTTFWVMPTWMRIAAPLTSVGVIGLFLFVFLRRRRRRDEEQAGNRLPAPRRPARGPASEGAAPHEDSAANLAGVSGSEHPEGTGAAEPHHERRRDGPL